MKDIVTFINEALNEEKTCHVSLTFIANPSLRMTEKVAFDMSFDPKEIKKARNSYRGQEMQTEPYGWQLRNTPDPSAFDDLMHLVSNLQIEDKLNEKDLSKVFKPICKLDLEVKENPNSEGFFAIRALKDGTQICELLAYTKIF